MSTEPEQEARVWVGSPSQWLNFWIFASCILIVTIPWAFWRWLALRCTRYEVTSERVFFSQGVFSRRTDCLELYRVRDIRIVEPFLLRIVGRGSVVMDTSDRTTPLFIFNAIPAPGQLADVLRENVEVCRRTKGVREVDFEDNPAT
jgi:uncharacterized membrane protein YdbT with pleckstrin-like domain